MRVIVFLIIMLFATVAETTATKPELKKNYNEYQRKVQKFFDDKPKGQERIDRQKIIYKNTKESAVVLLHNLQYSNDPDIRTESSFLLTKMARERSAKYLGIERNTDFWPELIEILRTAKDPGTRMNAVGLLGLCANKENKRVIKDVLIQESASDKDETVSYIALVVLGNHVDKEAAIPLLEARIKTLKNSSHAQRAQEFIDKWQEEDKPIKKKDAPVKEPPQKAP